MRSPFDNVVVAKHNTLSSNGRVGETSIVSRLVDGKVYPIFWVDAHGDEQVVSQSEAARLRKQELVVKQEWADQREKKAAEVRDKKFKALKSIATKIGVDAETLALILDVQLQDETKEEPPVTKRDAPPFGDAQPEPKKKQTKSKPEVK